MQTLWQQTLKSSWTSWSRYHSFGQRSCLCLSLGLKYGDTLWTLGCWSQELGRQKQQTGWKGVPQHIFETPKFSLTTVKMKKTKWACSTTQHAQRIIYAPKHLHEANTGSKFTWKTEHGWLTAFLCIFFSIFFQLKRSEILDLRFTLLNTTQNSETCLICTYMKFQ